MPYFSHFFLSVLLLYLGHSNMLVFSKQLLAGAIMEVGCTLGLHGKRLIEVLWTMYCTLTIHSKVSGKFELFWITFSLKFSFLHFVPIFLVFSPLLSLLISHQFHRTPGTAERPRLSCSAISLLLSCHSNPLLLCATKARTDRWLPRCQRSSLYSLTILEVEWGGQVGQGWFDVTRG